MPIDKAEVQSESTHAERIPPKTKTARFLRRQLKEARTLSTIDPKTGLPNELGFNQRKQQLIQIAISTGIKLKGAMIDIDDLKDENDSKGHAAGDQIIIQAAEALRNATRESDLIARLHGDEFAAILTGEEDIDTETWTKRLQSSLEEKGIKASIGIVDIDLGNVDASMERADAQMYVEKRRKKDK